MTTKYSSTYLGTIPANDEHVRFIIRSALKRTGFCLRERGRNPNRKQFYNKYGTRGGKSVLRQDLPLRHATSVALYLKPNLPYNVGNRIGAIHRKVADALVGQPVSVTMDTVAYLNEVKNLDKLHDIVTAIGKACRVLAVGPS